MSFIGYTTNLGSNKYLASVKYTDAGLRKYLLKSTNSLPIAITNPITNGNEYYLGNGLWESNSDAPVRNMIHDLEIHSFPVNFTSTALYDPYRQGLAYNQVNAYADTWTPENPNSRFTFTRNLTGLTNGPLIPPVTPVLDNNTPGVMFVCNSGNPYVTYYQFNSSGNPGYDFVPVFITNRETTLSSISVQNKIITAVFNVSLQITKKIYRRTDRTELVWSPDEEHPYLFRETNLEVLETYNFSKNYVATFTGTIRSGFTLSADKTPWEDADNVSAPYSAYFDVVNSISVTTTVYQGYPIDRFRRFNYGDFLKNNPSVSQGTLEAIKVDSGIRTIFPAAFLFTYFDKIPFTLKKTALFVHDPFVTPPQVLPEIEKQSFLEMYQGRFLAQKTTNGYIYQNWSATRTIKLDSKDFSNNENKLIETANILNLKVNNKTINLATNDFLVISSLTITTPVTKDSTNFTLTASQNYNKDFSVNGVTGQPILLGLDIENRPALIRGTITSASYSVSGKLTITVAISKISLETYTSFLNKLITDNGSYYSYHFRKKIPATFGSFINKSILKVIPLNPIVSTFLRESYVQEINEITGINLETDNIVNQKIYSVVNVSNGTASVEEWNILADGKIKYNRVFKAKYYKIPNSSTALSHSFYPSSLG